MNKTLKIALIVIGSIVAGSLLLLAGIVIGRNTLLTTSFWSGSMMNGYFPQRYDPDRSREGQTDFRFGYGQGLEMMGGVGGHPFGMMGGGMMGGYTSGGLSSVEPLPLEQAEQAVERYLSGLNNQDLILGEVMIFENHAYAQIVESSTGIGAMEVLVDPVTKAVYPEHGPNMMWNLKYGMMAGYGGNGIRMGSGMMGGIARPGGTEASEVSADMPVSPEQAVENAQRYLDQYFPGTQADEHADPFYGYYTLHLQRDSKIVGMLSVNGYSGQVFPHTWHGDFVEMSGE